MKDFSIFFFKQPAAKTVQSLLKDLAGFDMDYEKYEELCKEACKEKQNHLKIERLDDQENYFLWG